MEGATLVFALSLVTSTGPSRLHGNPFLMSAYLHIRTAQSQGEGGRERESEKGWAKGAREREEKSNNAISAGSLNDATLTTIWHFDKRGPDIVSSKSGLFFFYYILFCRQEDKTPPPSFLVNFHSHFVTVLLFPLCCPAYLDKSAQPSLLLWFRSYLQ